MQFKADWLILIINNLTEIIDIATFIYSQSENLTWLVLFFAKLMKFYLITGSSIYR